jgi:hypothetical protein
MKIRLGWALLAALCSAPAFAGEADDEIHALAQETGMTERQIRMLNGPSTAYAEYRTSYSFLRNKMRRLAALEAREAQIQMEVDARAAEEERAETYALPED